MFLKDSLKEAYIKAFLDKDSLLKDNIVNKWVHRFGLDTLNDLLLPKLASDKNDFEEETQSQTKLKLLETLENKGDTSCVSNTEKTSMNNLLIYKDPKINKNTKINEGRGDKKLPLPSINNLRKWINKDKKVS